MIAELILIYYTVLLAGHMPDDAIHHIAEVLSSVRTHTQTHTNLLVSEETRSSTPPPPRHHCVSEWVGEWSENVVGDRVKDTSFPRMHTTPSERALTSLIMYSVHSCVPLHPLLL